MGIYEKKNKILIFFWDVEAPKHCYPLLARITSIERRVCLFGSSSGSSIGSSSGCRSVQNQRGESVCRQVHILILCQIVDCLRLGRRFGCVHGSEDARVQPQVQPRVRSPRQSPPSPYQM